MSATTTAQGGKDFLLKLGYGFSGAVTFQDSGDTVTFNNHGLANGDVVRFSVIGTTTGIVINTNYYVVGATTNTFQLAAVRGGTALVLTTDGTGTAVEAFETVAGLRSTSFTFNAEEIDITNQDSAQWKQVLSGAGIKSVTVSGSGIFKDDYSFAKARTIALAQTLKNWRVCVNTNGDYWQGCFKITSMEQAGDYNNESSYSLSLAGSGEFTYTEV
jgi:TP901-1 family phage major tail protein